MSDTFDITVTARPRNAILWRAVKRFGSQAALARALDVTPSDLCAWINMTWVPQPDSPSSRYHDQKALAAFEKKLFEVTGALFDDVFPKELRESCQNRKRTPIKTIEFTQSVPKTALIGDSTIERLTLPSPSGIAEQLEIKQLNESALNKALECLTYRQREILKCRWGLNGKDALSLDEAGRRFKVTRERIRQIEAMAMRKLKRLLPLCGMPNASISVEE